MLFSGGSLDEKLQRELNADRNRRQIAIFLSQHIGQRDLIYSELLN